MNGGGWGWVRVDGDIFLVGGGSWTFFMGEWGWMVLGGRIFWVLGVGWTFFMGGWGWVEVYFGWVGVSGGGHSF